jgi:hypothetical protein
MLPHEGGTCNDIPHELVAPCTVALFPHSPDQRVQKSEGTVKGDSLNLGQNVVPYFPKSLYFSRASPLILSSFMSIFGIRHKTSIFVPTNPSIFSIYEP